MQLKLIKLINIEGEQLEEQMAPESVLVPKEINTHVIFESVNIEDQNRRQGTHDTKNKSEVSGTGKKPYRQKHTGRARQGSRRNPHFRGGGIAFGPTPEKNYRIRVNKKVSRIALITAWFLIIESEKISILDETFLSEQFKSKDFAEFLKRVDLQKEKTLLITSEDEKTLSLAARNIRNVRVRTPNNCSVRDLLDQNYLLVTKSAIASVYQKLSSWK